MSRVIYVIKLAWLFAGQWGRLCMVWSGLNVTWPKLICLVMKVDHKNNNTRTKQLEWMLGNQHVRRRSPFKTCAAPRTSSSLSSHSLMYLPVVAHRCFVSLQGTSKYKQFQNCSLQTCMQDGLSYYRIWSKLGRRSLMKMYAFVELILRYSSGYSALAA